MTPAERELAENLMTTWDDKHRWISAAENANAVFKFAFALELHNHFKMLSMIGGGESIRLVIFGGYLRRFYKGAELENSDIDIYIDSEIRTPSVMESRMYALKLFKSDNFRIRRMLKPSYYGSKMEVHFGSYSYDLYFEVDLMLKKPALDYLDFDVNSLRYDLQNGRLMAGGPLPEILSHVTYKKACAFSEQYPAILCSETRSKIGGLFRRTKKMEKDGWTIIGGYFKRNIQEDERCCICHVEKKDDENAVVYVLACHSTHIFCTTCTGRFISTEDETNCPMCAAPWEFIVK